MRGVTGPEVRAPGKPGRAIQREIASARIDTAAIELSDLRLDQPFLRKAGLVRIRLRIQGSRGEAGIRATRDENLSQVWIPRLRGTHDIAQPTEQDVGVGIGVRQRPVRLTPYRLQPYDLYLCFAQSRR